jgi:hypothetical protein
LHGAAPDLAGAPPLSIDAVMQDAASATTTRRRSRAPRIILLVLVLGGLAFVFRQGLVPAALNPLPALDLGRANPWLVDWRLAAMKYNPDLCRRVLVAPHTDAQPIADSPLRDGCGWTNAVRMSQAGGVRAGFDKLTCEAATALALWLEHDLQQAAQEILGQRVVEVKDFGTYSCRDIIGKPSGTPGILYDYVRSKLGVARRSEHATGNAVDIGGFVLANGRQISVRGQWRGDGAEARFLRAAHDSACRYFRVVLGPDYNAEHHDHFHLDRGIGWLCR